MNMCTCLFLHVGTSLYKKNYMKEKYYMYVYQSKLYYVHNKHGDILF